MFAVDIVGKEEGFDFVAFEIAVQKFSETPGEKRDQFADFVAGYRPESFGNPEQFRETFQALTSNFWGWFEKKWLQIAGQLLELRLNAEEGDGIPLGKLGDLRRRLLFVQPPAEHASAGHGYLHGWVAGDHAKSVGAEIQIASDPREQHTGDVRGGRGPAPRRNFFGDATPTKDFPPLENKGGETCRTKISSCGEATVAATDDNGVVTVVCPMQISNPPAVSSASEGFAAL